MYTIDTECVNVYYYKQKIWEDKEKDYKQTKNINTQEEVVSK